MWDTANGRIPEDELEGIVDEKVIHLSGRTAKIYEKGERVVRWVSMPMRRVDVDPIWKRFQPCL